FKGELYLLATDQETGKRIVVTQTTTAIMEEFQLGALQYTVFNLRLYSMHEAGFSKHGMLPRSQASLSYRSSTLNMSPFGAVGVNQKDNKSVVSPSFGRIKREMSLDGHLQGLDLLWLKGNKNGIMRECSIKIEVNDGQRHDMWVTSSEH
ncbi:hypothetical protein IFM89_008075, partial [Coptis chinensis]